MLFLPSLNFRCRLLKRRLLFLILFSVALFTCTSINATGYGSIIIEVTDDQDNPLPDVQVQIHSISGLFEEKVTPKSGIFLFPQIPYGKYQLKFSRPGFVKYQSSVLRIDKSSRVKVSVKLPPEYKPDLLEIPAAASASVTVYSYPGIIGGFMTKPMGLSETFLSNEPYLMYDNGRPGVPVGLSAKDLSFYLDGAPVIDPFTGGALMNPPYSLLNTIEIVQAGTDGLYVTPSGGLLKMETRNFVDLPFQGWIRTRYQVYEEHHLEDREVKNTINAWNKLTDGNFTITTKEPTVFNLVTDAYTSFRVGAFSMILTGSHQESDNFLNSGFISDDAYSHDVIWMKSIYRTGDRGLFEIMGGFDEESHYFNMPMAMRNRAPFKKKNRAEYIRLKYAREFQNNYFGQLMVSRGAGSLQSGQADDNGSFIDNDSERDETRPAVPLRLTGDGEIYHLKVDLDHPTLIHDIQVGSQFEYIINELIETRASDIDPGVLSEIDLSDWSFSLWGRDRWKPTRRLELTYALRWDRYHHLVDADHLSPRVKLSYSRGDFVFQGGFDRVLVVPNFIQNRLYSDADNMDDPDTDKDESYLQPGKGFRWFGEIEYRNNQTFTCSLGSHYSLISNPIYSVSNFIDPSVIVNTFHNGETARRLCVSATADYNPVSWFRAELRYLFSKTEFPFGNTGRPENVDLFLQFPFENRAVDYTEDYFESRTDNDIAHSIMLRNDFTIDALAGMKLRLDCLYRSGLYFTRQTEDAEINDIKGPDWYRIDIRLNKSFDLNPVRIIADASVINLLNTHQYPSLDPFTDEPAVDPYDYRSNEARNITLGLTLSF